MRTGPAPIEITDLLWPLDVAGRRLPVVRAEILSELAERGQRRARRIVARMPVTSGMLDPQYVDWLGFRVHCELQRLEEELQFGRRVAALLGPLIADLPGHADGLRVVDVGCGLGYVLRWLAATSALGDAELVGVDLNPALVARAGGLAREEGLSCRFLHGNAFELDAVARDANRTVIISSGLLHHLGEEELVGFFAGQQRLGVAAFAHWDIAPCLWSTLGAWMFHRVRMREPVSRHDGVMSARRSHPAEVLEAAARAAAPSYDVRVLEGGRWQPRALDVLRPIVGTRR